MAYGIENAMIIDSYWGEEDYNVQDRRRIERERREYEEEEAYYEEKYYKEQEEGRIFLEMMMEEWEND